VSPLIVIPIVLVVVVLGQTMLIRNFDYQCGSYGTRFTPSPLMAALAPHRFGGLKLLKCPSCRKVSWCSAVRKRE
jgi:hypothetical protein